LFQHACDAVSVVMTGWQVLMSEIEPMTIRPPLTGVSLAQIFQ